MNHHILIVEDDGDIREDLAELLREEGYQVTTAPDGSEALRLLDGMLQAGQKPCIILLDLMMPIMNGWEFCAKQRSCHALADVPVVLLSGASDLERQAVTLKPLSYLPKPINLSRLFELMAAHC